MEKHLTRTCKVCGETKALRSGFKLDRQKKLYSDVCKECEAKKDKEISELSIKTNLKLYIQRSWKKLCPYMTQAEMDQQIYKLKKIYEETDHVD